MTGSFVEGAQRAPAAARNRDPILAVLRRVLPARGTVLEIASGTGEHAVHFAAALPDLTWQPTDRDSDALRSIAAHRKSARLRNLLSPIELDASAPVWPLVHADAVVAINMIHIAPVGGGRRPGRGRPAAARTRLRAVPLWPVQSGRKPHRPEQCRLRRWSAGAQSAMGRARSRRRRPPCRRAWFRSGRAGRDAGQQSQRCVPSSHS